jgi:hypothetical protein
MQANFKEKRMADFRKGLVLAAAVLALGVTASAQQYSCTGTTGAPPVLRSEGNTELTGSIVITCNNVPAGGVTVNFDLTLNNGTVPITSRPSPASSATGAAALNGPDAVLQLIGNPPVLGTPLSIGAGGIINDVRFTGVTIPAGNDTITITGIRGNVIPSFVPIGPGGFGVVTTLVAVSNGSLPLQQNVFTTGLVEPGMGTLGVTASGVNFSTCAGTITATSPAFNVNSVIKFSELFPTAFKVQGGFPGNGQDAESGTNPLIAGQVATNATQFAVTFNSVPSGVTLYVPATIFSTNQSGGGSAVLVTAEGSTTPVATTGTGSTAITITPPTSAGLPPFPVVPVTGGTTVFYNVTSVDPSSIDTFSVPVYFGVAAGGAPSGATTTATVTYAPRQATSPNSVPRFTPSGSSGTGSSVNLFGTASTCQTTLLFTFLTNQAGFDSGFSIAGTGTGMFSDPKQGGTCTINLFGANAPATAPTLAVPSAGEGHTTISAIAPGFQGFGVAVCNFNYAHGYAFLSDGFMGPGRGLSEGYVANVLIRNGASTGAAEVLEH